MARMARTVIDLTAPRRYEVLEDNGRLCVRIYKEPSDNENPPGGQNPEPSVEPRLLYEKSWNLAKIKLENVKFSDGMSGGGSPNYLSRYEEDGYTYCAVIEDEKIIAVAAVWKYSSGQWEAAAVNTRAGFENRGLAKQVVSFVTSYILSQDKIPTLTTGEDNIPMRKVAEAIGYKLR
jgi:hypothetical protein